MFKRIFFALFFLLQSETLFADISNKIVLTVGNSPITLYDLKQEIKLLSILNPGQLENQSIEELQNLGIESLTIKRIKEQEIKKNQLDNIEDEEFIEYEMSRLLKSLDMDKDSFEKILKENQLEINDLKNHISIQIKWNRLVYQIYQNKIKINEESINKKVEKEYNMKKNSYEYLLSEIIVPVSDSQNPNEIYQKVKVRLLSEKFENVAKELSISDSSLKGGDLGWINENIVSKKVKSTLMNTPVGKLSEPIAVQNGILIFKVRDKRIIETSSSLEEIKNQLINVEKTKILNMHSMSHYDKVRRSISIKYFQ